MEATKRQLWALFKLTKKDHRDMGLTKDQASEMIGELMKDVPKPKSKKELEGDLYDFFLENINIVQDELNAQLNVRSIIVQEEVDFASPTGFSPKPNSRQYAFVGSGCGFAWLEYDRRVKRAKAIVDRDPETRESIAQNVMGKMRRYIVERTPENVRRELNNIGCPLEAILSQDLQIQIALYKILAKYLREKLGVKDVYVNSRLD